MKKLLHILTGLGLAATSVTALQQTPVAQFSFPTSSTYYAISETSSVMPEVITDLDGGVGTAAAILDDWVSDGVYAEGSLTEASDLAGNGYDAYAEGSPTGVVGAAESYWSFEDVFSYARAESSPNVFASETAWVLEARIRFRDFPDAPQLWSLYRESDFSAGYDTEGMVYVYNDGGSYRPIWSVVGDPAHTNAAVVGKLWTTSAEIFSATNVWYHLVLRQADDWGTHCYIDGVSVSVGPGSSIARWPGLAGSNVLMCADTYAWYPAVPTNYEFSVDADYIRVYDSDLTGAQCTNLYAGVSPGIVPAAHWDFGGSQGAPAYYIGPAASTNATDIAINAGDIATNAINIATNAANILSATGSVASISANISSNAAALLPSEPGVSPLYGGLGFNWTPGGIKSVDGVFFAPRRTHQTWGPRIFTWDEAMAEDHVAQSWRLIIMLYDTEVSNVYDESIGTGSMLFGKRLDTDDDHEMPTWISAENFYCLHDGTYLVMASARINSDNSYGATPYGSFIGDYQTETLVDIFVNGVGTRVPVASCHGGSGQTYTRGDLGHAAVLLVLDRGDKVSLYSAQGGAIKGDYPYFYDLRLSVQLLKGN